MRSYKNKPVTSADEDWSLSGPRCQDIAGSTNDRLTPHLVKLVLNQKLCHLFWWLCGRLVKSGTAQANQHTASTPPPPFSSCFCLLSYLQHKIDFASHTCKKISLCSWIGIKVTFSAVLCAAVWIKFVNFISLTLSPKLSEDKLK